MVTHQRSNPERTSGGGAKQRSKLASVEATRSDMSVTPAPLRRPASMEAVLADDDGGVGDYLFEPYGQGFARKVARQADHVVGREVCDRLRLAEFRGVSA